MTGVQTCALPISKVAESGQQSRELFRETGIAADENQARRLRNDIASFRGYLEQQEGHQVSETVAAHRWLEEVYDPVVEAIPASLRGRLSPPEIFHEILEHRWYLSERSGRDVGTTAAARSYFETVLPQVPAPLSGVADPDADALDGDVLGAGGPGRPSPSEDLWPEMY